MQNNVAFVIIGILILIIIGLSIKYFQPTITTTTTVPITTTPISPTTTLPQTTTTNPESIEVEKYCELDQDCKSLNGCDAGCWNTDYEPPGRTGEICPTLLGPESCKCYQNECTPTCSVDSDCDEFYVECEEGETLTCQNSLCLCQEM